MDKRFFADPRPKGIKPINRRQQWQLRKLRSNNRKPRIHPARDY